MRSTLGGILSTVCGLLVFVMAFAADDASVKVPRWLLFSAGFPFLPVAIPGAIILDLAAVNGCVHVGREVARAVRRG